MRFLLLALALASAHAQTFAQPTTAIRGVISDSATGEPLAFVRVRLVEWHREVTTHADGRFAFAAVSRGRVTIAAQRIGYASRTVMLDVASDSVLVVPVRLERSASQLAATVITGAVDERPADRSLSATTVVTGAALDRRLDATLSATLAGTPGFVATSMGPATARPVLRGLGGDRVLVLEDGQRPGDLSATSADHATAIDPIGAKQIDVVRGPMSLLFGPNALGGVVNVIADAVPTSLPDDAHGVLSLQGNSVQPGGVLAGMVTARQGQNAWRVEGSARHAGDLRTPAGIMGNTQLTTLQGGVGVSRISDRGHTGFSLRQYVSSYGLPGGFTGAHPRGVDLRMTRTAVRAETERHFSDGPFTSMRATAQYALYGHQELGAPGVVTTSFLQNLAVLDAVARHDAWGLATSGAIGVRAQGRSVNVGGATRATDTGDWQLAAFAVQEYGRGRLRGQAGLRYDVAQYVPLDRGRSVEIGGVFVPVRSRVFGNVSGSVGAILDVADGIRVGSSVARAFRTPDFNELFSDGPHLAAYSYDVGNPAIRQETGLGAEAFVRVARGGVTGEASVFRNALSNFIYARNTGELGRQGFAPKFQYVNTDAVFTGADGGLSWAPASSWVVDASFSYVRAQRVGLTARDSAPGVATPYDTFPASRASQWLPWIPPLQGTTGVRWEGRRWFAGSSVRVASRQERTGDYERPTDGFTVVNAVAGARLLVGGRLHTITLRVDNLTNVLYRDHLSRTKVVLPEAGRNVSVLYRMSF
jgi:iron complex outermembrane recepter protein